MYNTLRQLWLDFRPTEAKELAVPKSKAKKQVVKKQDFRAGAAKGTAKSSSVVATDAANVLEEKELLAPPLFPPIPTPPTPPSVTSAQPCRTTSPDLTCSNPVPPLHSAPPQNIFAPAKTAMVAITSEVMTTPTAAMVPPPSGMDHQQKGKLFGLLSSATSNSEPSKPDRTTLDSGGLARADTTANSMSKVLRLLFLCIATL